MINMRKKRKNGSGLNFKYRLQRSARESGNLGGQIPGITQASNNMIARGVHFDVIGESYYPKWHGTLDDLRDNLNDLVRRYAKDVIVVEYSRLKEEVNKIAFELPDGKGKGTCIWEPLNTWESVFDKDGKSNNFLLLYDELSRKFLFSNQNNNGKTGK